MKNIYLDFDRTIYDTDSLYKDMNEIIMKYGIDLEQFEKVKRMIFGEPILFNYFKVIKYISYHNDISLKIIEELENIINNGDKYIYNDVEKFIKNAKSNGYTINILTYGDANFQLRKLSKLRICDIIDNIFIVSVYKFDLELDYTNSIFIDDNPRDLEGLYKKKAGKIIRISRKNTKYSKIKLDNNYIENYNSLSDIDINKFEIKGDVENG